MTTSTILPSVAVHTSRNLSSQMAAREEQIQELGLLVRFAEQLLGEPDGSPSHIRSLEVAQVFLQQARDQMRKGDEKTGDIKLARAADLLNDVRAWVNACDQRITPLFLKGYIANASSARPLIRALIRHILTKQPRDSHDRDKLDCLVTEYIGRGAAANAVQASWQANCEELFTGVAHSPLSPAAEDTVGELASLAEQVAGSPRSGKDFLTEWLERARGLKAKLSEEFYHPRALAVAVHFNTAFRYHFLKHHYQQQLETVCKATCQSFDRAIEMAAHIHDAYQQLSTRKGLAGSSSVASAEELENNFRFTLAQVALFLRTAPAEQLGDGQAVFSSFSGKFELAPWEQDAFLKFPFGKTPAGARTIQYAVGLVVFLDDELARYQRSLNDEGGANPHFDSLSYGVKRALEVLVDLRALLREGGPELEGFEFHHVAETANRLAAILRRVVPTFQDVPVVKVSD